MSRNFYKHWHSPVYRGARKSVWAPWHGIRDPRDLQQLPDRAGQVDSSSLRQARRELVVAATIPVEAKQAVTITCGAVCWSVAELTMARRQAWLGLLWTGGRSLLWTRGQSGRGSAACNCSSDTMNHSSVEGRAIISLLLYSLAALTSNLPAGVKAENDCKS